MRRTLLEIDRQPDLELSVCITGMHLDPLYGDTWRDVERSGLRIAARIKVSLNPPTGATMARAVADIAAEMVNVFERERPDVLLLLGDRGEMMAAALTALHMNVPI